MTFRKILFWTHLLAGLAAGLSIAIMCFTGTLLAFEKQIVAFAERDVRQIDAGVTSPRRSLAELQHQLRKVRPEARPTAITVSADPTDAVVFQIGREEAVFVNPYTGEIKIPATTHTHDFLHLMEDWHRWLALGGDGRTVGKAINGACNLAFLVLAITGLYLWLPRTWSWRGVKAVALFNWRLAGKARDFNWHNSIGLWSAPILIVLTITALPISYRWAGNLIYTLAGETPPVRPGPPGAGAPDVKLAPPSPGARPLGHDALLATAQQKNPGWEQITLRLGGARGPRSAAPVARSQGPQPVSVTVKTPGTWPRTATTTLILNPFTAEVMKTETFSDMSTGRRIRTWTRSLHTGEALGWGGQLAAGLASLGGCFLVYTGVALSWRRFFGPRRSAPDLRTY